jgi:hypothetical protein
MACMVLLWERLQATGSLEWIVKILFERRGARMETASQVVYWVNTAGLAVSYQRRMTEGVAGLCAMDLRYQGKPMRVRLKDMAPGGSSLHGQVECPFFQRLSEVRLTN